MKHKTNPGGWWAAYFPTVMDGPVLRLRPTDRPGGHAEEINVGREGIGGTLTNGVTPELVAMLWRVHEQIREPVPDPLAAMKFAMGDAWTIDRPHFGDGWPVRSETREMQKEGPSR